MMGLQERMRSETDEKVKSIIERAERSSEETIRKAQIERDADLSDIKSELDEKFSERIRSASGEIELEEKITVERAKEKLFFQIRDEIIKRAEREAENNYLQFITSSIIRGAETVNSKELIIALSNEEKELFAGNSADIRDALKKSGINIIETKFLPQPKGAVIYDKNMRRSFTDTIQARVKRIEDSIRDDLLAGLADES